MKKLSVLVIGAAGYVLGSRAGRERYEQIKGQATKLWNRPAVQDAAGNVEQAVKSTASDVGSKIADAASDAGAKVVHKVKGAASTDDPAGDPADDIMYPKTTPAGGGSSF